MARKDRLQIERIEIHFQDEGGCVCFAKLIAHPPAHPKDTWDFSIGAIDEEIGEWLENVESIIKTVKRRRRRLIKTLEKLCKILRT